MQLKKLTAVLGALNLNLVIVAGDTEQITTTPSVAKPAECTTKDASRNIESSASTASEGIDAFAILTGSSR